MQTLLTPEDSKRVADAIIEKIEQADFDIAFAVKQSFDSVLWPKTKLNWKEDWLPLIIEDLCDKIANHIRSI